MSPRCCRGSGLARSACLFLMLTLAGCGAEVEVPELYQVTGKVTYQGKPVPRAKITFIPMNKDDAKRAGLPGDRAAAETDDDGNFLVTWGTENEGAPAGKYMVTILAYPEPGPNDDPETAPPSLIPLKFADPKTSGLNREVKEQDNVFNFNLDEEGGGAVGGAVGPRDE
ncbi:MAG: hypothetical protein JSS02_19000 [Planctomycetes bacterium]|nr:hypothetical protein [Planctomycetota bacterium]